MNGRDRLPTAKPEPPSDNVRNGSSQTGLTSPEVAARRRQGLSNSVQISSSRSLRDILMSNVFSPINVVLYVIGVAMIAVNDVASALGTVGLVLVNALVGVVQEVSAKRQLDQIALLTRTRVNVLRDSQEQAVDPNEIVLGDVLVIRAGDQVPVDGKLLGSSSMEVDESALTGESNLVQKGVGDKLLSGSICVTGAGLVEATGVGEASFANKITKNARQFKLDSTPLQRDVNRLLRLLLLVVLVLSLLAVLSLFVTEVSLPVWLRALSVITGIVSAGLLTLITLNYSWGSVRIGQKGAFVQQINSVEALSHVTVLCADKTGTITTNRFEYREGCPVGVERGAMEALLADFAASVSAPNATVHALVAALPGTRRTLADEVPFSSARKWSALAFADPPVGGTYVLGAAEMLRNNMPLPGDALHQIEDWSNEGLRVLVFGHNPDVTTLHDAEGEPSLPHLTPLGVICFADELRPHLPEMLAAFHQNAVKLKIISGDNPETVAALARQAGLGKDLKALSGVDLQTMTAEDFSSAAMEADVFGRITPQQKEALVGALQREGEFVAMIGDGVNDVPSLKRANVGIAMVSGSTAARSVAAIVLRHDSFEAMPVALAEGQRTVGSILNVLKLYFVSVLALIPLIGSTTSLGLGFPYTALQSTLLSFFARGVPPLVVSVTTRPFQRHEGLARGIGHFTLPAAAVMFIFGLMVYVGTFAAVKSHMMEVPVTPEMIQELKQSTHNIYDVGTPGAFIHTVATLSSQTALTIFLSLSGILLMLFASPPTPWFAVAAPVARSWLTVIAAILLLIAFTIVLLSPGLSLAFELMPLPLFVDLIIGVVTIVWMLVQRELWRGRWVERFLDLEP